MTMLTSPSLQWREGLPKEPVRGERHEMVVDLGPLGTILSVRFVESSIREQREQAERAQALFLAQTAPFAYLADFRGVSSFPSSHRAIYAEVRERVRPVYARHHVTTLYVVDGPVQRGFITAIGWVAEASETSGKYFVEDWHVGMRNCRDALQAHARAKR